MGFEIPEPYVWDESFKVFYDNLDEEHKGLFNAIFAVAKTPGDGGALATLKKKVDEHFQNEEGMMKKANYPDFASHSQLHVDFVQKLSAVATPVSADTVNFAKEWLVNHIKATDHKYINKL